MRRPFKDFRPLKKYRKFTLIDTGKDTSQAAVDTKPQQVDTQSQERVQIGDKMIISGRPDPERLQEDSPTIK